MSPKQLAKLNAPDVPRALRFLHSYAMHALGDGFSIKMPVDDDVFGHEHIIYILFEDIHSFCQLDPIGASCICVYIW